MEVFPSDLEILTCIYVVVFLEWPWRELHAPDDVRIRFDEVLRWPETIFLVARDLEGRPIGAGIAFGAFRKKRLLAHHAERVQNALYISELFVDPAYRGRGVCRELIVGLLQAAREAGYTEILVDTSVHQKAIRHLFVHHFGFQEIAEEDYASPRALPDATLPTRRVLMRGVV